MLPWVAVAIAIVLLAPTTASADFRSQNGNTFASTDKLTKARQFDELASSIMIPADFGAITPFELFCTIATTVRLEGEFPGTGVKKIRAKWDADVLLLDHRDGSARRLDVADGVFKTGEFGDFFTLAVPDAVTSAIFTDGFESGNVSALLVTRVEITRGKRINFGSLQCLIQEDAR